MDELEQFLSGGGSSAKKPQSTIVNNPGNLRPVGGSSGFQQFSTPEEGIAAADKNLQAYGKKGINTLRGVISRWAPPSENDTEAYINTVSKKIGLDPNQQIDLSDPVQRHVISGAMFTVEKGSKNLFKAQQQQPTDELEAFLSGGKEQKTQPAQQVQPNQPVAQPQQTAQPQQVAQPSTTAQVATDLYNRYQGMKRDLGQRAAGAVDTLYGVVPAAYGAGVQALARTVNTPERAEQIGQSATQSIAQPFGKAAGVTGKESYQKPLGGITEPVVEQIKQWAEKFGLSAEQLSKKFGIPVQDVRNMLTIGSFATPQAIKEVTPAAKQVAGVVAKPIREAAAELKVVTPEQQMQQQFAVKQGTAGSVGAAKAEFNPYAGQITGEETARGQFPQVKLSKTSADVPKTEQATRSAIAQEILGKDQPVRTGVITGNENTLRTEHAKAKMPDATPEGQLLKQQIANEQTALSNYAQQRVENTGASPTLVTPYERGERINSAFAGDEGLSGFFKQEKRNLFDEARQRTGNNPIQSQNIDSLLQNKQFKAGLGLKGNEGVAKSAQEFIDLAKTVGFEDEAGNFYAPNTVGAWTAVLKALNKDWTPQNASVIRKFNQAIERDIGAAGGLDLLKKADQLHQAEKVLFGSEGIKQIFGDIDPNGVQTATAFEAIPQKLNSMPVDQWKHIYETAEKVAKGTIDGPIDKSTGMPKWTIQVPEELRVSAESAMNEMRGNIAREIYQAGAAKAGEWNQNAVNKILNARSDKIKLAFSPEEQQAFHTLNVGGYLMPGVHSYEGAGLQGRRVQGIIEGNLGKMGAAAGATVGGAIAGPPGAAVGGYLGGQAGLKAAGGMEARALNKAAEKTQKQMQKNAQMGQNTLNDINELSKKGKK